MAYSQEVYESVQRELERRRMTAQQEAAARHERHRANPRVRELETIMAQSAMKLAAAIANKDNYEVVFAAVRAENTAARQELEMILQQAGESITSFSPRYTCAACEDTGYVGTRVCACRKELLRQEATRRLQQRIGMKLTSFEDMDLSFYDGAVDERLGCSPREHMQSVIEYCRWYASSFATDRPNLLLRGATGTGKTHTSLAIAAGACESGAHVIYGPIQHFLHVLEAEHFGRADGNTEQTLLTCDLLILDDLGTEFPSPFYTSALYSLVNGRQIAGLPTIISTNLDSAAIYDRYGEQITSRLIGNYEQLVFVGNDIRQQKLNRRLHGNG